MSALDLARLVTVLEGLESKAFRWPWTYSEWEIRCPTCEADDDCNNPECDGANVPCTTIESPTEYPNGQIVAQFTVPGLKDFADANGAFIVALRNAFPVLIAAASENATLRKERDQYDADIDRLLEACGGAVDVDAACEWDNVRKRQLERAASESATLRAELARAYAAHAEQVDEEAKLRMRVAELTREVETLRMTRATQDSADGT